MKCRTATQPYRASRSSVPTPRAAPPSCRAATSCSCAVRQAARSRRSGARRRFSRRWRVAHIAGLPRRRMSRRCWRSTKTGAPRATSTRAFRRRSSASSLIRSSCFASKRIPRKYRPTRRIRSATSSWPHACPSFCGAAFLTMNSSTSRRGDSFESRRSWISRFDACSPIPDRQRWSRTSPASGCSCASFGTRYRTRPPTPRSTKACVTRCGRRRSCFSNTSFDQIVPL